MNINVLRWYRTVPNVENIVILDTERYHSGIFVYISAAATVVAHQAFSKRYANVSRLGQFYQANLQSSLQTHFLM